MSLHNEQSPEILALDAAVEENRQADPVSLPAEDDLTAAAEALAGNRTVVSVAKLCARAPWFDGLAALYGFNVSRWDSPANLVYCFPNQAPAGSWDGTVVYIDFTAPDAGEYAIVARYHGSNTQVRFRGPWGTISETMPSGQDHDTLGTLWTGSGGLFCTLTFAGSWMGMVSEVQVFKVE